MKSFEYAAPKKLKDATALLDESWGKTEILAGGTDLVTSRAVAVRMTTLCSSSIFVPSSAPT